MIVRWIKAFLALIVGTAVVSVLLDVLLFDKELFLERTPLVLVFYALGVSLILYYSHWIKDRESQDKKDYYEINNEAFLLGLYLGVLSSGIHMLNSPQLDPVLMVRNLVLYGLAGYLFGKAMKGKTPDKKKSGGNKADRNSSQQRAKR